MKYIIIQNKTSVSVSKEVYTTIKTQKRYEERLTEKKANFEVLIGEETEFDRINNETALDPYEILESREVFLLIMKIINTYLSPSERYILTSIYLEEKRLSEVAKKLDLKVHQVKYLAKMAKRKVRKIYYKIR